MMQKGIAAKRGLVKVVKRTEFPQINGGLSATLKTDCFEGPQRRMQ